MKFVFFDIEVYKNLNIISLYKDSDMYSYVRHNDNIHMYLNGEELPNKTFVDFLNGIVDKENDYLVGFNSNSYDMVLLSYLYQRGEEAYNAQIYRLSNMVINSVKPYDIYNEYKIDQITRKGFKTIDIFNIVNNGIRAPLKLYGARLHYKTIKNLPYDLEKELTFTEAQEVVKYCETDVLLTKYIFDKIYKNIELRFDIQDRYQIKNILSQSNPQIVEKILESKLEYHEPIEEEEVKYIKPVTLYINNEAIKEVLNNLEATSNLEGVVKNKIINISSGAYKMGIGGLHSQHDINKYYITDRKYSYYILDVVSYYPNIIVNYDFYPKNKYPDFLKVYEKFLYDRLELKKKGIVDSDTEAYKIILNGTFGKFNSENSKFYSKKSFLNITINGQLFLLMLIEALEEGGFNVISANTDGIMVKVDNSKYDEFESIYKEWEVNTNFDLELKKINKLFLYNVNNYFYQGTNGSLERKGWFERTGIRRGSEANIIKELVIKKLLDPNIDISQEIRNCKDIKEFIYIYKTTKSGVTFKDNSLGKVVRWIKTKDNQECLKIIGTNNKVPNSDNGYPIMDLNSENYFDLVDYDQYVELANKELEKFNIKKIIPCKQNTKVTILKDWLNKTWDKPLGDYNQAWVLSENDLVLDIDIKTDDNAYESAKRFCKDFNIKYDINVKTPSGGAHVYLRKSPNLIINKKYINEYPGVEFKSKNSYILVPPSKIFDKEYKLLSDNVIKLTKTQEKKINKLFTSKLQNKTINEQSNVKPILKKEVVNILNSISPDVSYDEWFKIILGIRDWAKGKDKGFKICVDWSKEGEKYNKKAYEQLKRIYYDSPFRNEGENRINFGKVIEIRNKYLKKELENIKGIDQELDPIINKTWYKNWALLRGVNNVVYIDVLTGKKYNQQAFNNVTVNEYKPNINKNGEQIDLKSTSWLDKNKIELLMVDGFMYNPKTNDRVIYRKDNCYVNDFNENTLTKPAEEYTESGKRAIEFFKKHCDFIALGHGKIILNYIAHILQRRGERIKWFLLLGSEVTGVGKTFIVDMVKNMLGEANYVQITKNDLRSNFNSYVNSKLFVYMDEYGTMSNDREMEDIEDKLKTLITDNKASMTLKYMNPILVDMYCNGIFTTNKQNCIHNAKNDRRFYICYLNYKNIEEVMEKMGFASTYEFNKEIANCHEHIEELVKFFLSYEIDETVFMSGRAPSSESKDIISFEENESIFGYIEAKNLIENEPCFHYNEDFVCQNKLFEQLSKILDTKQTLYKTKLVKALGYTGPSIRGGVKDMDGNTVYPKFYNHLDPEERKKIIEKWRNN